MDNRAFTEYCLGKFVVTDFHQKSCFFCFNTFLENFSKRHGSGNNNKTKIFQGSAPYFLKPAISIEMMGMSQTKKKNISSWWLNQHNWKRCSSKWVHLPQISGENKKCFKPPNWNPWSLSFKKKSAGFFAGDSKSAKKKQRLQMGGLYNPYRWPKIWWETDWWKNPCCFESSFPTRPRVE